MFMLVVSFMELNDSPYGGINSHIISFHLWLVIVDAWYLMEDSSVLEAMNLHYYRDQNTFIVIAI